MNNKRFDEPPPDLNRMACCVNALIEVLELNIHKLRDVEFQSVAEAVKKIARYNFTPIHEGFVSIMIQDVIDSRCKSAVTRRQVMELCSKKHRHYLRTKELI